MILLVAGYFYVTTKQPEPEIHPVLDTQAQSEIAADEVVVLTALGKEADSCPKNGVEGSYRSCSITIIKNTETSWKATVLYSGLMDDSVRATKTEANIAFVNGRWEAENVQESWQCGRMDSSPEFITELCP